jgi:hypothetical protein
MVTTLPFLWCWVCYPDPNVVCIFGDTRMRGRGGIVTQQKRKRARLLAIFGLFFVDIGKEACGGFTFSP